MCKNHARLRFLGRWVLWSSLPRQEIRDLAKLLFPEDDTVNCDSRDGLAYRLAKQYEVFGDDTHSESRIVFTERGSRWVLLEHPTNCDFT